MRLFGWFRTRWQCPMCGGEVTGTKPQAVQDEQLGFSRPSQPCPHCGYDPYEPMAPSRWQRRRQGEELLSDLPEERQLNELDELKAKSDPDGLQTRLMGAIGEEMTRRGLGYMTPAELDDNLRAEIIQAAIDKRLAKADVERIKRGFHEHELSLGEDAEDEGDV
jgi:hypothetical protein